MFNILNFNSVTPLSYSCGLCSGCGSYIVNFLLNYKVPENVVVTPSTSTQVITPSAKNRALNSVTVQGVNNALNVTPSTSIQTFTNGPYSTVTVQAAVQ